MTIAFWAIYDFGIQRENGIYPGILLFQRLLAMPAEAYNYGF
jgi:hypothetical protein